ncbi:MAG: hypothetical protein O8C62_01825 [Candidatus Methanoperedens sp.]|nr:hypothetical protein [Candidatus Methanoperedens sp.]
MNESNNEERKLQFEEYKLFRDTTKHFDQILIDIRKSTITLAFILFGAAAETFRITNMPSGLNQIDLAIALVLIELLIVMAFFYLEFHYRFYLVKIADIATEYEKKLGLGIELEKCDDLSCGDMRAGISKCLKCIHENGMAFSTRVAHFNIYTSLLSLGLVAFYTLMGIKIGITFKEILPYSIIIGLIAFGSSIVYGLRSIRKRKIKDGLNDTFNVYLLSIIFFVAFTYILYYYIMNLNFFSSFFGALIISIIIFLVYGFNSAKIEDKFKRYLFKIGVAPEKF